MTNEQTNNQSIPEEKTWMDEEIERIKKSNPNDYEDLPGMKFDKEGFAYTFEIDFSNPFKEWKDGENGVTKKIIPIIYNGERYNWWINVANPTFADIMKRGVKGQRIFNMMKFGDKKLTRYKFIELPGQNGQQALK